MSSNILRILILLFAIKETQCIMGTLTIPPEQDLIHDIDRQILVRNVAPILKTSYLSTFQGQIETQYKGIIYGPGLRTLTTLPLRFFQRSCPITINVIFKVDTGAPITTLTREVLQKLYQNCPKIQPIFSGLYSVKIAGHQIRVQQSKAHYKALNILGADFLLLTNSRLEINYSRKRLGQFKLLIQGTWIKDDEL